HLHRLRSVKVAMLGEINFYRKLLRLDPMSLDAFSPPPSQLTINPSFVSNTMMPTARFESMPPEILDRIASFVDGDSIVQLCHSMPYFKYISKAMLDLANVFPEDFEQPEDIRPTFHMPSVVLIANLLWWEKLVIPTRHLYTLGMYSRVIARHGSYASVHCAVGLDDVLGALPDTLHISCRYETLDKSLYTLATAKKRILYLDILKGPADLDQAALSRAVTRLSDLPLNALSLKGATLPTEMYEALPTIVGLYCLQLESFGQCGGRILSKCANLNTVEFEHIELSPKLEEMVHEFIVSIRTSNIRKLSFVNALNSGSGSGGSDRVMARIEITSMFAHRGWQRESSDGASDLTFVYLQP
ncbi:hypothetical protein HDU78_009269, partial [Chytriomyces hyalinus]